jgi:hypothetical protein
MAQLELPEFEVKPSQDFKGWLVVTCPRQDCGEIFLVRKKTWLRPHTFSTRLGAEVVVTGRACPYCFKAGAIPRRLAGRYTQGSSTANTTTRKAK